MEPLQVDKKEKFLCPSCFSIVKDPVECLECETPFGRECFVSWFEKNKEGMQCRAADGCK